MTTAQCHLHSIFCLAALSQRTDPRGETHTHKATMTSQSAFCKAEWKSREGSVAGQLRAQAMVTLSLELDLCDDLKGPSPHLPRLWELSETMLIQSWHNA